jgi:eukaryotic-like serine/threonine-protein kinase
MFDAIKLSDGWPRRLLRLRPRALRSPDRHGRHEADDLASRMLACPECRKPHPNDATECAEHHCALVPLETLPDEEPPIDPGTMVGEYRVDRKLGSGTFGDVYAGEQPLIGKKVAVKVLHRRFASSSSVVSRFVAEARAVNRIRHRNIIDIFSFGMLADDQPYFVMELLDGVTLGELLDRRRRVGVAEALPILRGIAEGLDAAHEAGITHRDLKPDNIFLASQKDGTYFPKLLDFGVAKLFADDAAHKTATGAAIGTPSYMAPEQCRGKAVDHRADIYALGVVIHEVLTGSRLFHADSAMDVLFKHVSEAPPRMSSVAPDLPRELDAPVLAMLAKSPADRPSSAGAAVAALAEQAQKAGVAEGRAASEVPTQVLPRGRDQAHVETLTVDERARVTRPGGASAPSAEPTAKSPGAPSAGESGPIVVSTSGGGAASDGEISTARTMLADGPTTLVATGAPPPKLDPTAAEVTLPAQSAPPPPVAETAREPAVKPAAHGSPLSRPAALAIGAAALVATVVALQKASQPAASSAPEATASVAIAPILPASITIRLAVTPADADVIVDGLRVGAATDPVKLPRSDQSHTIRLEKPGFEPQNLVIESDRDRDMPSIALKAMAAAAPTASASAKPATAPGYHGDLERPVYRRHP